MRWGSVFVTVTLTATDVFILFQWRNVKMYEYVEKKCILRMLWSTTVLQALEDVYTSGIIAEIPMQLEHWMVFEKPDPLSRFQWSNMNDKIQQIYESIVFWQVSTSWKWKLPLLSYKDMLSKQHSFPLPVEARKVTGVFQRTGYRTQNWWNCKGHLKVI